MGCALCSIALAAKAVPGGSPALATPRANDEGIWLAAVCLLHTIHQAIDGVRKTASSSRTSAEAAFWTAFEFHSWHGFIRSGIRIPTIFITIHDAAGMHEQVRRLSKPVEGVLLFAAMLPQYAMVSRARPGELAEKANEFSPSAYGKSLSSEIAVLHWTSVQ